ncbi:tyrosine-type recombinase/integrase [Variovorax paradoxus]|uniref:Integrase family protein n=1 Tax=Variovorax paradoxus (strain EPS) TaxID=595537 RepID=E6V3P6_VARPE|nr:integrase arm-type DNA-binding domain-containing protein [Variovorax paradoxus]ADU36920.1 integrase family protein [Variovorax paradoxus EPS]
MALTDMAARKAKPEVRSYNLTDGAGLYLQVTPAGGKLWRWNYRHDGKQKTMAFGSYPEVSIADAREAHQAARKQKAAGADPMAQRKLDKIAGVMAREHSFKAIAQQWHDQWKPNKAERHARIVWGRLENDVFPAIGARPISEVKPSELVAMIKKIAGRGAPDMAKRCLEISGQVFRYAVAHGISERNPAADIKPGDVLPPRKTNHFARVESSELPDLLRKIEAYSGTPATRLAMKLMAYTFVRTGELIGARWPEFDLDAAVWRIPPERMKMKTLHIVPLSTQAVEVLRTLQLVTGDSALLFPGERDHEKSISNNTILGALKRMGYAGRMTGHGFRGVASTELHEMGFEEAHIEAQMSHLKRNRVASAYDHSKYLKQRVAMMQTWADRLDQFRAGAKILPFKAA